MYSLEQLWRSEIYPNLLIEKMAAPATGSYFDDKYVQSSITFDQMPQIIFVADMLQKVRVEHYIDLPSLAYDAADQRLLANLLHTYQTRDPNFYDGDHILITDLVYAAEQHVIYIAAVRVKYVFICALMDHQFPDDSIWYQKNFYKTGVLAPCITTDLHTFFVKRTADNLYSAAGGFLQPITGRLNFANKNLVLQIAEQELLEEFFGVWNAEQKLLQSSINITLPQLSSISFRKGASSLGTIDFIAPSYIECDVNFVTETIKNNNAKDAHEHSQEYLFVPLQQQHREQALEILAPGIPMYNGAFLYHPMLFDTYRLVNMPLAAEHYLLDSWRRCVSISSLSTTKETIYENLLKKH